MKNNNELREAVKDTLVCLNELSQAVLQLSIKTQQSEAFVKYVDHICKKVDDKLNKALDTLYN